MVDGKGIIIHIYSSNEQILIIRGNDFFTHTEGESYEQTAQPVVTAADVGTSTTLKKNGA